MKTYVVFQGCYSDRDAVGVFDDEDIAQKFADQIGDSDVMCFTLNEHVPHTERGLKLFGLYMRRNGDSRYCRQTSPGGDPWLHITKDRDTGKLDFYCEAWARDKEHAIKIVNERRAYLIANNLWYEGVEKELLPPSWFTDLPD